MKKTYKSILILVTLIGLGILYLLNSEYMIKNFIEYSKLFLTKLFPVSFLFYTLSSLLLQYGLIETLSYKKKKSTTHFYVFLLSLISGFPSGAKYTKELLERKKISIEEGNQILTFSHFPNPFFILGTITPILKKKNLAIQLYTSLILSNTILFLTCKKEKTSSKKTIPNPIDFSNALVKATEDSFHTLLIIYGTSIFFYLISTILIKYLALKPTSFILLNGLFDLTKGVFSTSILEDSMKRAYYILLFLSFGGISIHMQVKSILSDTSLSYSSFLKGRIIATPISFLIFYILTRF